LKKLIIAAGVLAGALYYSIEKVEPELPIVYNEQGYQITAENVIDMVDDQGLEDIIYRYRSFVNKGLDENHFTQSDLELENEEYLDKESNDTLAWLHLWGYDSLSQESLESLQRGLDKGQFTQDDIDEEQTRFLHTLAYSQFSKIKEIGINAIDMKSINYGIEEKLFTQEEINIEDNKFLFKDEFNAFELIAEKGFTLYNRIQRNNLKNGVLRDLFTPEEIVEKHNEYLDSIATDILQRIEETGLTAATDYYLDIFNWAKKRDLCTKIELNATYEIYLDKEAKRVFSFLNTKGISGREKHIERGKEKGFYTQAAVDVELLKLKERQTNNIPRMVENQGLEEVLAHHKDLIDYGLANNKFTQEELQTRQGLYLDDRAKYLLNTVSWRGLDDLTKEEKTTLYRGIDRKVISNFDLAENQDLFMDEESEKYFNRISEESLIKIMEEHGDIIDYAIKKGHFTDKDLEIENNKYLAGHVEEVESIVLLLGKENTDKELPGCIAYGIEIGKFDSEYIDNLHTQFLEASPSRLVTYIEKNGQRYIENTYPGVKDLLLAENLITQDKLDIAQSKYEESDNFPTPWLGNLEMSVPDDGHGPEGANITRQWGGYYGTIGYYDTSSATLGTRYNNGAIRIEPTPEFRTFNKEQVKIILQLE